MARFKQPKNRVYRIYVNGQLTHEFHLLASALEYARIWFQTSNSSQFYDLTISECILNYPDEC